MPGQNYIARMRIFKTALVPTATGSPASATTGYCDYTWFNNSQLNMALFGGSCYYGALCGAFACYLSYTVAGSGGDLGASPQHSAKKKKNRGSYDPL